MFSLLRVKFKRSQRETESGRAGSLRSRPFIKSCPAAFPRGSVLKFVQPLQVQQRESLVYK